MEKILGAVGIFALLYSFIDAWHDEKVIRQESKWHFVDAIMKGLVSVFIGIVFYYFTKDYFLSGVVVFLILLIRACTFNFFINNLMDYQKNTRRKKGFDKVPTWIWWVLLIGLTILTLVRYD